MGTLPLFAVLPIKDLIEGLGDNIYFVAAALVATGFLLFASDRVRKGRKTEKTARLRDVFLVGVAQAIATCPGISRSGTTITAGCFVGLDRKFAVRYSFLMSIPAILGANLLTLKDAITENTIVVADIPVYLVGVAVAAVVGYLCIRLLKMIADKGRFGWFAYYCWAGGRDRAGPGAGAGLSGPCAPQRGAAAKRRTRFPPEAETLGRPGFAWPTKIRSEGPPQDRRSCGAPFRLVRLLLLGGGRDRAGPGAGAGLSGRAVSRR